LGVGAKNLLSLIFLLPSYEKILHRKVKGEGREKHAR
jgi:hypothetical protein